MGVPPGFPKSLLFLAEAGDTAVGLIHISIDETADLPFFRSRCCAVVHSVIVREERRDQGIGQRLMDRAHEWAVDRGATRLELSVWTANQAAMSFYEELGYSAVLVRLLGTAVALRSGFKLPSPQQIVDMAGQFI